MKKYIVQIVVDGDITGTYGPFAEHEADNWVTMEQNHAKATRPDSPAYSPATYVIREVSNPYTESPSYTHYLSTTEHKA